MVKSAVRAMDTVTALLASDQGGKTAVKHFRRRRRLQARLDDLADRGGRPPGRGHRADRH